MGKRRKSMAAELEIWPWDKQPREPDEAWAAFQVYRDMGDRSLRELGKSLAEQRGVSVSVAQSECFRWSASWHWRDRVDAWDREQDRVARQALQKRQANVLRTGQQVLALPTNALVQLMTKEPLLAQKLADEVLEAPVGGRMPLTRAYRELVELASRSLVVVAQLGEAEQRWRGGDVEGVGVRGTATDGDSEPGAAGELPDTAAVRTAVNAVLLAARGYGVESGRLRLVSDAG